MDIFCSWLKKTTFLPTHLSPWNNHDFCLPSAYISYFCMCSLFIFCLYNKTIIPTGLRPWLSFTTIMVDSPSNRERAWGFIFRRLSYFIWEKLTSQKTAFLPYWLKMDHMFTSGPITSKEKWGGCDWTNSNLFWGSSQSSWKSRGCHSQPENKRGILLAGKKGIWLMDG